MSYSEKTLLSGCYFDMQPVTNYGNVYHYNNMSFKMQNTSGKNYGYVTANVFEANKDEVIAAAGFFTALSPEDYDLSVYLLDPDCTGPQDGTPVCQTSGTVDFKGFHTIELPEHIAVKKGQKYSVVIKQPIGINHATFFDVYNYKRGVSYYAEYTAETDLSDLAWKDCYDTEFGDVCIHVYTEYESETAAFLPGDMDRNGKLTAADLSLMKQVIRQPERSDLYQPAADWNGDDEITAEDVRGLLGFLLATPEQGYYRNLWREIVMKLFHGIDVERILGIKGKRSYGISLAVAKGDETETYCSGSGRYGQDFPVNPDMLFQAGSVSKPMFALTLLRYVDKGLIDLNADISGVLSDFVKKPPLTFPALLSHTAGYSVGGFPGYRADAPLMSLEDVIAGRGNSKKILRIKPYGKQFRYSGGGITLAELAFTRLAGISLREAFQNEVAEPLHLTRTGYFQPLDEDLLANAAFGGRLAYRKNEDSAHGYHYYPEHAAAGLWTTPAELTKVGIELSRSFRKGGLIRQKTAERMAAPIMGGCGLCLFRDKNAAYHYGGNEGFLTFWRFSLKEDICIAGMFNKSYGHSYDRIKEIDHRLSDSLLNTDISK